MMLAFLLAVGMMLYRFWTCRGQATAADRIEQAGAEFHARLRTGFLELAKAEPARFAVIDASRPLAEVSRQVLAAVRRIST